MTKIEFNTIVLQHAGSLKSYALNFTRDTDDANDLVQETLLKAITFYNKFSEGTNIKGWLYTIMKNTFINGYRKFIKAGAVLVNIDVPSAAQLSYSATVNSAEGKFVMGDIQRALAKLHHDHYTPFSLYFEGYKYHEIAEQLNVPIGTVKTRIHIARQTLKKNLSVYAISERE